MELKLKSKGGRYRESKLQVRDIGLSKQISNPTGLNKDLGTVQRPEAIPARLVKQPEVLIRCAAEHRERRQRQARSDLRVYGVGQTDAAVAGAAYGTRARSHWITHRLVNR